jgi:uncharacterized protein YbjT (DUF2867 family)
MRHVLVTGATGKIGSQLAPRLAAREDIAVRALVRSAERAAPLEASGVELAPGRLEDCRAVALAMHGIDTLVLITPAGPDAAEQAGAVIGIARRVGVRKIVRISAFKAGLDAPTDIARQHGRTEMEIQASGLTHVILRPPFFLQNLCALAARGIATEGKLYLGMGEARVGMIDLRDVVDCAEQSVISDAYDDEVLTLTGPESIGCHDLASRLGCILGCAIQYVSVTPEGVRQSVRALGFSDWYAEAMGDYSRAYRAGWGDVTTDHVSRITGRPARSFDAFAREILVPGLGTLTSPRRRSRPGAVRC